MPQNESIDKSNKCIFDPRISIVEIKICKIADLLIKYVYIVKISAFHLCCDNDSWFDVNYWWHCNVLFYFIVKRICSQILLWSYIHWCNFSPWCWNIFTLPKKSYYRVEISTTEKTVFLFFFEPSKICLTNNYLCKLQT